MGQNNIEDPIARCRVWSNSVASFRSAQPGLSGHVAPRRGFPSYTKPPRSPGVLACRRVGLLPPVRCKAGFRVITRRKCREGRSPAARPVWDEQAGSSPRRARVQLDEARLGSRYPTPPAKPSAGFGFVSPDARVREVQGVLGPPEAAPGSGSATKLSGSPPVWGSAPPGPVQGARPIRRPRPGDYPGSGPGVRASRQGLHLRRPVRLAAEIISSGSRQTDQTSPRVQPWVISSSPGRTEVGGGSPSAKHVRIRRRVGGENRA